MPDQKFSMADYVPVNERIAAFLAKHPEGSLQSELIELNETRVVMRAYAYRTPTDERPGIGYSSLEIPGRTPYTRGSEIENCETSAWGRAIAALGFEVKRGIASAEEVRNKRDASQERPVAARTDFVGTEAHPAPDDPYQETEDLLGDYAGAGMIRLGENDGYKLESRDGPTGHIVGFRMEFKDDKAIPQVIVEGPAGEALYLAAGMNVGVLRDTRLHVKGRLFSVKSNRRRQSWKRLRVVEWSNRDYMFPAAGNPAAIEAETAPLFDDLPGPGDEVVLVGEKAS